MLTKVSKRNCDFSNDHINELTVIYTNVIYCEWVLRHKLTSRIERRARSEDQGYQSLDGCFRPNISLNVLAGLAKREWKMNWLKGAVAFAVLHIFLATPAFAERDATREETKRVISALTSLGYSRITDVDVVGNRFVVDARSPQGRDVDVELDRRSLKVIREIRS